MMLTPPTRIPANVVKAKKEGRPGSAMSARSRTDAEHVNLQGMLRLATPVALAGLCALITSRAGILNIAGEGMILFGAWFAVAGSYFFQSALVGVLAAMLSGAVIGTLPDLDVFANLAGDEIGALAFHRAITHSVFFSLLAPLALGWLVLRIGLPALTLVAFPPLQLAAGLLPALIAVAYVASRIGRPSWLSWRGVLGRLAWGGGAGLAAGSRQHRDDGEGGTEAPHVPTP